MATKASRNARSDELRGSGDLGGAAYRTKNLSGILGKSRLLGRLKGAYHGLTGTSDGYTNPCFVTKEKDLTPHPRRISLRTLWMDLSVSLGSMSINRLSATHRSILVM